MNRFIKILILLIIMFFLTIFFSRYTNYNQNTNILTEAAIEQFEKDLKDSKEIVPSNYLPKEKNYDNKLSLLGKKTSNIIEKYFGKVLRSTLKYLYDINEE